MLTSNSAEASPEISRLIEDILLENARYKRDLRTFHREPLVCPIMATVPDEEEQHCVSRNISPAGISLISAFRFEEKQVVSLEIYRLSKSAKTDKIVAECRWIKPFGEQYWMSGWLFLRLKK